MSHTEYIIDSEASEISAYDILWASASVVAVLAAIYMYVLPRFKKPMKTF